MTKRSMTVLLPAAILAVGLVGAAAMMRLRAPIEEIVPEAPVPVVRVIEARPETIELIVRSEGTVEARRATTLVSEVAGRVVEVAPSWAAGGFFEAGDLLLRIDPTDYELAVEQARAQVAQARLRIAQEEAAADVARRELDELAGDGGEDNPLATHELQLAEARAALAAAQAALRRARRDLERTRIVAPFTGRLLQKQAELGQFLTRGAPVAQIYAVDVAEVRLPIPDRELAYVDLPLARRGTDLPGAMPRVTLSADFAGRRYRWEGRIVRTEGQIDPQTRMVYAVAQVQDPYGDGKDAPLAVGLFVEAAIHGRTVEGIYALPRAALRDRDLVYVVDSDDTLHFSRVGVLRLEPERVLIDSGLEPGDRVCISPLDTASDGMPVRAVADAGDAGEDAPR